MIDALNDKATIAVIFIHCDEIGVVYVTSPETIRGNILTAQVELGGNSLDISDRNFSHATMVTDKSLRHACW